MPRPWGFSRVLWHLEIGYVISIRLGGCCGRFICAAGPPPPPRAREGDEVALADAVCSVLNAGIEPRFFQHAAAARETEGMTHYTPSRVNMNYTRLHTHLHVCVLWWKIYRRRETLCG